jgi:nucleotide-binding universal stress UspA family protein
MGLDALAVAETSRVSTFPTKVLFATDGSRDAELAATTAVGLVNTTGSELHLIHVGPVVPEHYEPTDVEPVRIHREATKILQVQSSKIEILHGKLAGSHLRMGGGADPGARQADRRGTDSRGQQGPGEDKAGAHGERI